MVIITGTSKGIGKAVAEHYLLRGHQVVGIGRSHSISHEQYLPLVCDLSDPEAVNRLTFPESDGESVVFIHNAGILGTVDYFERLESDELPKVMQVNLFSGAAILQMLLKMIPKNRDFKAVFISSGAGKNPIASWASYCASKAAVDLFCQTIQVEENQLGREGFHCLAVAPGVVDTAMQAVIRSSSETVFADVARFREYHSSNQLYSPELVAEKLYRLVHEMALDKVVYSLRDVE